MARAELRPKSLFFQNKLFEILFFSLSGKKMTQNQQPLVANDHSVSLQTELPKTKTAFNIVYIYKNFDYTF